MCVLISFPSSSSLVRRCQVSAVLSAITALNSSLRLCVECVRVQYVLYVCIYGNLAKLAVMGGNNAAALEATPQSCSKLPLVYIQMDFVKFQDNCGESIDG